MTAVARIASKGSGSIRERRPGVWEIRIAAGTDVLTGRTIQRSITVHGSATDAEQFRQQLAADYAARRDVARAGPLLTVDELLSCWLAADHPWRPSTRIGYVSNARALHADRALARLRVMALTPRNMRDASARWTAAGATTSVIAGRVRVLRAAVGWAYTERILEVHPLRGLRGPGRAEPRRPLPDDAVHRLLAHAETAVLAAIANDNGGSGSARIRQGAEQDLLLVRLAADTGARRGELAALGFDDLDGRVLTIRRALSGEQLGPPKSGRARTVTVGASAAALWHRLHADWEERVPSALGPWVFATDAARQRRLGAASIGHRFTRLRDAAEVPGATLHRLRHSVATFLVARGQILQAQARLGHADAATTLREYAYALPLTDAPVADAIDAHLDEPAPEPAVTATDTGL